MLQIDLTKPFALYFNGLVIYDGRACSELGPGNFLLLYKNDKSVSIHGGTLITPRNYLSRNGRVNVNDNTITFELKKEKIIITISTVHSLTYFDNWAEDKVIISRTEAELVNKLMLQWEKYFGNAKLVRREHITELGTIDLMGITIDDIYIVVEAKRKKVTINHCTQLLRYVEHFVANGKTVKGYMASPTISDNALKYLHKHKCDWVKVDFGDN